MSTCVYALSHAVHCLAIVVCTAELRRFCKHIPDVAPKFQTVWRCDHRPTYTPHPHPEILKDCPSFWVIGRFFIEEPEFAAVLKFFGF